MKPARTLITILAVGIILGFVVMIALAAGNDFVNGQLRVDLPEVYNAGDYRLTLRATAIPISNGNAADFTTAWLSVDLNNQPGLNGSLFTQVGLIARADGLHWFVYTEAGVVCQRGTTAYDTKGCIGDVGDLVSLGNWYQVELANIGGGWWMMRLYDAQGHSYNLAETWVLNSTRIYAATATMEEGYSVSQDPYLTGDFYLSHPQYMTAGGWKDWPASASGNDNLLAASGWDTQGNQYIICPDHYGMDPNYNGDERAWFAGSYGQQCSWVLFPSAHSYLPLILKQPTPTPSPTPIPSPTPTAIPTRTPTNTPTPLPTLPPTPTQPPVAQCGQNALLNPGFESGLPGTPWTKYSSGGYPLISTSRPRTGSWGASLGGYNNALDRLYQGFTLPSGVTKATVTFWWYVVSQDSTTTPYDYLNVVMQSPPGNDLSGRNQVKNTDARGAWYQSAFDIPQLGPWAGSSLWFTIEVTNDVSLPTSFYVDDVSFVIQCGGVSGLGGTPVSPLPTPTPHR